MADGRRVLADACRPTSGCVRVTVSYDGRLLFFKLFYCSGITSCGEVAVRMVAPSIGPSYIMHDVLICVRTVF